MDAREVRAAIAALPPAGSGRRRERMRALLDTNRPDMRYLVARVSGTGADRIARVCAAVLRAAGAPTGVLAAEPLLPDGALDDALYVRAGRLALAGAHQTGVERPELGGFSRREVEVALALTAFAEASVRVALLVERTPGDDPPLGVVDADLVVAGRLEPEQVETLFAPLESGRPLVAAPQEDAVRDRIAEGALGRGIPLLLGGRDFTHLDVGAVSEVTIAGERYADLPRDPAVTGWQLATGVAAALGIGTLGIRMRPEWVSAGAADAARAEISA